MKEIKQTRYLIKHFRDLYLSHNAGLLGDLDVNHLEQYTFKTEQKASMYLNKWLKEHPFKDGTFKIVKLTITAILEE